MEAHTNRSTLTKLKSLTTVLSCGAIAVLGSGCHPPAFQQKICADVKDRFESDQELLSKRFETGGKTYGLKPDEIEAAIKEDLKSNLEHHYFFWKANNCSGSMTDPG